MSGWAERVRAAAPHELEKVRDAVEELERHDHRLPSHIPPFLGTATQWLLLTTALCSTVLAGMHLWSKLSRQHARDYEPEAMPRPARRLAGASYQHAEDQRRFSHAAGERSR
jgi:hypothetical protein